MLLELLEKLLQQEWKADACPGLSQLGWQEGLQSLVKG